MPGTKTSAFHQDMTEASAYPIPESSLDSLQASLPDVRLVAMTSDERDIMADVRLAMARGISVEEIRRLVGAQRMEFVGQDAGRYAGVDPAWPDGEYQGD